MQLNVSRDSSLHCVTLGMTIYNGNGMAGGDEHRSLEIVDRPLSSYFQIHVIPNGVKRSEESQEMNRGKNGTAI